MRTILATFVFLLTACATTDPAPTAAQPADPDFGSARREPCGGGPLFPPEEEPKPTDEQQPSAAEPQPQRP